MSVQSDFDEELVRLWVQAAKEGNRKDWIAEQMRTSIVHIRSRGDYLRRKQGLKLPHLAKGTGVRASAADVDKLNAIIKEGG